MNFRQAPRRFAEGAELWSDTSDSAKGELAVVDAEDGLSDDLTRSVVAQPGRHNEKMTVLPGHCHGCGRLDALQLFWSNGMVEGQIHRLKLIKR